MARGCACTKIEYVSVRRMYSSKNRIRVWYILYDYAPEFTYSYLKQ